MSFQMLSVFREKTTSFLAGLLFRTKATMVSRLMTPWVLETPLRTVTFVVFRAERAAMPSSCPDSTRTSLSAP